MTLYNDKVYFGAWNSYLYALDQNTGKMVWSWTNNKIAGYSPRMVGRFQNPSSGRGVLACEVAGRGAGLLDKPLPTPSQGRESLFPGASFNFPTIRGYSPAFLAPVAVNNRIFMVTPDYYVTCLDAGTGKEIWRETKDDIPVWFSMGLAKDGATLYVKARNNKGFGISTSADRMNVTWQADLNLDDDNSVTPVIDDGEHVYFASENGLIIAVDKKSSKTIWQYKFSNSSLSMIKVVSPTEIYASSTDGKIVRLQADLKR